MATVELTLTLDELDLIKDWYRTSAENSGNIPSTELFALLDLLGIEADCMDLWLREPSAYVEKVRPSVEKMNTAVRAYRDRHPNMESVKKAIAEDAKIAAKLRS